MGDEKEIFSCYAVVSVGELFFCGRKHMNAEDLAPPFHELNNKCDGMIKEPGVYAINVQIVRLK